MPELPPSRLERASRAIGYVCAGLAGTSLLINPPASIQHSVLSIVSVVVGLFLLSGLVAAVAAWEYLYRIEYVCLTLLGSAVLIYFVVLWAWVATQQSNSMFAAFLVTYLLAKIISRFAALHRLVRAHKRGG